MNGGETARGQSSDCELHNCTLCMYRVKVTSGFRNVTMNHVPAFRNNLGAAQGHVNKLLPDQAGGNDADAILSS